MAEIAIQVVEPGGRRTAQLVDDRLPVRNLIPVLVRRLGLPDELYYQLVPQGQRSGIPIDLSLATAGVPAGSKLFLEPVRDDLFHAVLKRLYQEAKNYLRDQLIDLARRKLEEIFRVAPDYPDPAGLGAAVGGGGGNSAPPAAPAAGAAAVALPTPPAASGSGGVLGCLVVLAIGGVVAYANRVDIERWWEKNKPAGVKQQNRFGGDKAGTPEAQHDPYGVFVGGGYDEVLVGRLSVILDTPTPNLVGWGLDDTKKVKDTGATFRMVLGPFATADEARRAYEENIVPGTVRELPLARGTVARFRFDDKDHMMDNATRLLR